MPIPVGAINFGVVSFDATDLANALSAFIVAGDGGNKIAVTDLNIISRQAVTNNAFTTLAEAISAGTKLFDALAYFSLPAAQRPTVQVEPLEQNTHDPSPIQIGRGIYYVFMYILLRGHAPAITGPGDTQPIPQFLSNVMNMTQPASTYASTIASFDINRLDHTWIKHVRISGLDQKTKNRLALGMAGYRLPGSFALYAFRTDADAAAIQAATAIRNFVMRGATWDCHAVTRSAAFLDVVKNFNANCGNLLLRVYTTEQIDRLVQLRVLYAAPVENPRFTQWTAWTDNTFNGFTDFVFTE
jgi:hypothetical protein